jgi:hypothetical protein
MCMGGKTGDSCVDSSSCEIQELRRVSSVCNNMPKDFGTVARGFLLLRKRKCRGIDRKFVVRKCVRVCEKNLVTQWLPAIL